MLSKKLSSETSSKQKQHRNKTVTFFSFIVLIVIVISFVGVPVVSQLSGESVIQFGSYDGVSVEYSPGNYFAQQVEYLDRYFDSFGLQNKQKMSLVWNQAFQQTARRIALKREAELAGIIVTDEMIDTILVNHPAYQKNGYYSNEAFLSTSTLERYQHRQEAKNDELIQQYVNDHLKVLISKREISFLSQMKYPQRQISFVVFDESDYPDSFVKEYAQKHKQLFRTIDLSRITIKTSENEANKIRDEIMNNIKTFEDAAKESSKDAFAESAGVLNTRYYYELKDEFEKIEDLDQIFSITKGDISPILKKSQEQTEWVFYKVNQPPEEANLSDASVLSHIRSYMNSNDRGLVEDYLKDKAQTLKAATAKTFNSEARNLGKTVQTTKFFSVNFDHFESLEKLSEASSDPIFQKLGTNEDFFKKAFHTPKGEIADPVLVSPSVLVFKVDDIKESPAKALAKQEDETDQLQKIFLQERQELLSNSYLSSPKFKNHFDKTIKKLSDF